MHISCLFLSEASRLPGSSVHPHLCHFTSVSTAVKVLKITAVVVAVIYGLFVHTTFQLIVGVDT